MKKIISFLMAVGMLAAMLTVFALPASAAETAEDYMALAESYESEGNYLFAALNYNVAATDFRNLDEYAAALNAFLKAGECALIAEDVNTAVSAFTDAGKIYAENFGEYAAAADAYLKAGECALNFNLWKQAGASLKGAAKAYDALGNPILAGFLYLDSGDCYAKASGWSSAVGSFGDASKRLSGILSYSAKAADMGFADASERCSWSSGGTASVLSEGSLTIVCSAAAAAVGFLAAMIIFKKKRWRYRGCVEHYFGRILELRFNQSQNSTQNMQY